MATFLVGIGLAFGLSAALVEWAIHIAATPEVAYALAFPPLLLVAARAVPPTAPDRTAGLLWIVGALAVELFSFAADLERFGRLSIPMGIIGFLRFTGAASLAPAALAFFVVPIPKVISGAFGLELVWQAFAEALLGTPNPPLQLGPWDSGLRLVAMFAGLGWYSDARTGGSWQGAFRRGAQLAMLGLPVQLAAVIAAFGLANAGAPGLARQLLVHGVWLIATALTVMSLELGKRQEEVVADV
jgi:hypothetical protein